MSGRFQVLTEALAYIEGRLADSISPQAVADACHYSLSGLQKMFSHVFHIGLAEYIGKRRMTLAARDLLTTQDTVLEIALRYGYASHEVFLRAFRRVWGETPSHFRQSRSFADIYPPHIVIEGGNAMLTHKPEMTQLYDAICQMAGTYAVILDTEHLSIVNDQYGHVAGDLVIAECLRRIDMHRGEDMLMFRIAGDEYILLTGLDDAAAAEQVAAEILAHNGEPIVYAKTEIPVGMRYAITRLEGSAEKITEDAIAQMRAHWASPAE